MLSMNPLDYQNGIRSFPQYQIINIICKKNSDHVRQMHVHCIGIGRFRVGVQKITVEKQQA